MCAEVTLELTSRKDYNSRDDELVVRYVDGRIDRNSADNDDDTHR